MTSMQSSQKPSNGNGTTSNTTSNTNTTNNSNNNNGDNSDNSGFSLGNNSFGFNFDSEDNNSSGAKSDEDNGNGNGNGNASANRPPQTNAPQSTQSSQQQQQQQAQPQAPPQKPQQSSSSQQQQSSQQQINDANSSTSIGGNPNTVTGSDTGAASSASMSTSASVNTNMNMNTRAGPQEELTQEGAAAAAHAQLQDIANQSVLHACGEPKSDDNNNMNVNVNGLKVASNSESSLKRKSSSISSGYKSDDEGTRNVNAKIAMNVPSSHNVNVNVNVLPPQDVTSGFGTGTGQNSALSTTATAASTSNSNNRTNKGKKPLDDGKRVERNQREKERSYRITSQINELRSLLSTGGVIVPKGTKNAVLTEAANYIRILQQQQYKSEIHRQQLIQQMQMIGAGQLGSQAANAIRHVAAQNGVWSLGNFGGIPPRSAMSSAAVGQPQPDVSVVQGQPQPVDEVGASAAVNAGGEASAKEQHLIKNIEDHDYRFVFNSCVIGMAIASMGGAFIDCNQLFIELSEYTKQEICALTIFNLTAKDDLQNAFDLISQMISPPADSKEFAPTCVLRGNLKNRSDLGLNITLIKDEEGIAKCFCVTLIRSPASPFDDSKPIQATADLIRNPAVQVQELSNPKQQGNMSSPAFMTG